MSTAANPVPSQSPGSAGQEPSGRSAISLEPQELLLLISLAGLAGAFFAPWASSDPPITGASIGSFDPAGKYYWIIPLLAVVTGATLRWAAARQWLGAVTALAAWYGVVHLSSQTQMFGGLGLRWGGSLTVVCALGVFIFSGQRRFTLPADLVARRLNSRKAEVFSHWGTLTPDIHFSSQEFYRDLETAITAKEWPGVETLRVEYREGGPLSHGRQYFRVIKERQLFDVCAASFGKDYFFTLREAEIPAVVTIRVLLAVLLGLLIGTIFLLQLFGVLFGVSAVVFLCVFGIWFLLNVLKLGLTRVDSLLVKLPVLGVAYEAWFRKDTYFQQDTRTIFLQSITELVKKKVEETTAAKGLKLLRCFERAPVMDGLYKQSVRSLEPDAPAS